MSSLITIITTIDYHYHSINTGRDGNMAGREWVLLFHTYLRKKKNHPHTQT